jgi:hypothetical protein
MNGWKAIRRRNKVAKSQTNKEVQYTNRLLKKSQKKHKEFDVELKEENFNNQMKFIKDRISPNGGIKPFKTDSK